MRILLLLFFWNFSFIQTKDTYPPPPVLGHLGDPLYMIHRQIILHARETFCLHETVASGAEVSIMARVCQNVSKCVKIKSKSNQNYCLKFLPKPF